MKIIIIPNEPNPNMTGRHYGISKTLAAQGHEVHSLMWDLPQNLKAKDLPRHFLTSLQSRTYKYENFTIHKIRRLPLFWPYVNGWLFSAQVKKLYRQFGVEIIFAESYTNETRVPKSLPFIYDLADDYAAPAEVYGSAIYKLAFKILGVRKTMEQQCRNALAVTAVSEVLCNLAKPYNQNVIYLPNGVETDLIKKVIDRKPKVPLNPHSIIYVTGFGPWSRPLEVIRTVTELRQTFKDIQLTLVGEGSEVKAMQQYIADNDAESYIQYLGFIHDRTKVFELIQAHAIGLNISDKNKWRDAAHPMKVIEYSALGKKVVSTDLEGVKSLGYPNVFMFSDASKTHGFKSALKQALVSKKGAADYKTISDKVLREYSWNELIAQLVTISRTLLMPAIVHISSSYPPNLGGLEKVVQTLARTQSELGNNVSVITSNQGTQNKQLDAEPFTVQRLKSFVVANTTIMFGLYSKILGLKPSSLIHVHLTQAFVPEVVWLAAKWKHFDYIVHIHLDVPASGPAGFLLKVYKPLVLGRVLRTAKYVIVFTEDQKQDVHQKYRVTLTKIAVIPNGAEASFFYNKPRALHTPARLLFVGRLGYQKNLAQLFHALDGVSEKFQTKLVGDGEQKAELERLVKKLRLKNIVFAGRADGETLRKYYHNSDIFVLTSEREGMPLVLLEAMASGLPIVATNVTGNRDVVQNKINGLLVPYGDEAALRSAILQLSSNTKFYQSLSQTSRKLAENYSWSKIAERIHKLYVGTK